MIAIGERVPDLTLRLADDTPCPLSQYAGKKLLLAFVRHLGCVACHAHLSDLDKNYQTIRAAGAEVLAVSMRKPEFLREFLKHAKWSIPMACDPDRAAYRLFGLVLLDELRLGVIGVHEAMVRGWMPGIPPRGRDGSAAFHPGPRRRTHLRAADRRRPSRPVESVDEIKSPARVLTVAVVAFVVNRMAQTVRSSGQGMIPEATLGFMSRFLTALRPASVPSSEADGRHVLPKWR